MLEPPRPQYFRKVIHIRAEDSPNVRLGLAQTARNKQPTGEVLVPGVLQYDEYRRRRKTWDKVRQCIGLDGKFYEGGEILLFPPLWLNRGEQLADLLLRGRTRRAAIAIGVDSGEGGDDTSLAAVDYFGLLDLISYQTPNTAEIPGIVLAFMRKHGVEPEMVLFDRGGGGKQHADVLRQMGHEVRTVAFGESLLISPRFGSIFPDERLDNREEKYAYVNRRAQMYGELSLLFDPDNHRFGDSEEGGFALPAEYAELRRQLAVMPKLYDPEGRQRMLPKDKRSATSTELTLRELLGRSPDQADAAVLAVHGMLHPVESVEVGIID